MRLAVDIYLAYLGVQNYADFVKICNKYLDEMLILS
jgi:hypothetical protein